MSSSKAKAGKEKVSLLNRYTDLPSLLSMLQTKQLTFLSPKTWDDRNDRYLMQKYVEVKQLKSVLALCFSKRGETYHDWRVFTHGSSGVRIEFEKKKLLSEFQGSGFQRGNIKYLGSSGSRVGDSGI